MKLKELFSSPQTVRRGMTLGKIFAFLGFLIIMSFIGLLWFLRPKTSVVEKRNLTEFPKLSLSGLWDGTFFSGNKDQDGVEKWYADTFPLRETLISMNQELKSHYGERGTQMISTGQTADHIDEGHKTQEELEHLAGLDDTEPATEPAPQTEPGVVTEPSGNTQPVESGETQTPPETEAPPETSENNSGQGAHDVTTPAELSGDIYITEGCGYGVYYFNETYSARYCLQVNSVAKALQGKANVYCLVCPISAGIMLSDQVLSGFPHLFHIKRGIGIVRVPLFPGRRKRRVVYHIVIGLDRITESWMEIQRHFPRILHTDLFRQPDIEGVRELLRRNAALRVKHREITQRVHPGVCPARSADLSLHACQFRERSVQFSLYGRDSAFLCLKSRITGAVIGHREKYSLHNLSPRKASDWPFHVL